LLQWIMLTNRIAPIASEQSEAATEEHFSVVDQQDQVIGSVPRGKVHANNLLHRAVHVLIFDAAGQVFLQKRSQWKDRHPLAWDSSAAGHVTAGEEYDTAASREVREELGANISLEKVAKLSASQRTGYEFIWLYRGLSTSQLRPDPKEIEAGEYFSPHIVDAWIEARPHEFAPAFVECWKIWRGTKR
jgi:16S rRNA (adenine1518-N6/adenine1519-N6)-dimethyltransferase